MSITHTTMMAGMLAAVAVLWGAVPARTGSLEAPAAPNDTNSAMHTLSDVYRYFTTGVRGEKRTGGFAEPAGEPTNGTGHTVDQVFEAGIIPQATGQTVTYHPGDDGTNQTGRAWPNPRFTVLGDINAPADPLTNQVRDNLTGLIWARHANVSVTKIPWADAMNYCDTNLNLVQYGGTNDWRIPNRNELLSLADARLMAPSLPWGHPFIEVDTDGRYWASTTTANDTNQAFTLWFYYGGVVYPYSKTSTCRVWPVRGGR